MCRRKLVAATEFVRVRNEAKDKGLKVVFTNGCFDILHVGHVHYLSRARRLGDMLLVGLNSDASVRKLKGERRPIVPQADRAGVLCALSSVDYVCIFDEETPDRIIREVAPDVLVKGGDYRPEEIVGADFVRGRGGEVVVIEALEGRSTQSLIDTICRRFGS
ncbi:MAG: D-glycero-beta-D-manno-heptose 1-phosphate adenylyltransferase [Candidatus Eisenbacteria bacterium]|nr:D-glycero-beta-D-manno-heptose 1-phosphate adenylyltransferase [Candidatus Eisenbacteria bacterium]